MEALLRLLPAKPQPLWVRYGTTVLLVGICFLLCLGLQAATRQYGFYLMFPAIFLPAILFDRGSGFLGAVLSTLLLAYSLVPEDGWHPASEHLLSLVFFFTIALAIVFISEGMRKALESAVEEREQKNLLLTEMAHRFKNNLAIARSIFSIQARALKSEEARNALNAANDRFATIANAHEFLVPSDRGDVVGMLDYLQRLCTGLGDSLRGLRPIAVRVECDELSLSSSKAIAIGLITNELVTNAIKYAFPDDRAGVVVVRLARGPRALTLLVTDNGIGCPEDAKEGLGSKVTRLLVEQLAGTLRREPTNPGCRVTIDIPN